MIHARNGRTKSVKMSLWIHATCLVVSVNDLPINQNGLRVSGPSSAPPCLDTVCCFVACFSAHHVHEMVVVSLVFQSQRYNSSCESADRAANTSLGFVLLDTASVYLDWIPFLLGCLCLLCSFLWNTVFVGKVLRMLAEILFEGCEYGFLYDEKKVCGTRTPLP